MRKRIIKFCGLLVILSVYLVSCSVETKPDTPKQPEYGVPGSGQSNNNEPEEQTEFTITFNANDGTSNPETVTQLFTKGEPKTLKSIQELGFSKDGYNFAGWGLTSDATEASYADETNYSASADVTFYAVWSVIPVYSVKMGSFQNGTITANPASGVEGTEITLTVSADTEYQFRWITVSDVKGNNVQIKGKGNFIYSFSMPAGDVTVTASFEAIKYTVSIGSLSIGSISNTVSSIQSSVNKAAKGTVVQLTVVTGDGCELTELSVSTENGENINVQREGLAGSFIMPGENVIVSADFIRYTEFTHDEAYVFDSVTINNYKYDRVKFGDYPQTIKSENVTINESDRSIVGDFTYYKGSDGAWYVKAAENACRSNMTYSDGTSVGKGGTDYKYFKVEPLVWRRLIKKVETTGEYIPYTFLLSEKIITKIDVNVASLNNGYKDSDIWSWLTENFESTTFNPTYLYKTFIKTQFSDAPKCEIFIPSVTTIKGIYGFSDNDGIDETRAFELTDYAKAVGADGTYWLNDIGPYNYSEIPWVSSQGKILKTQKSDLGSSRSIGIVPAVYVKFAYVN